MSVILFFSILVTLVVKDRTTPYAAYVQAFTVHDLVTLVGKDRTSCTLVVKDRHGPTVGSEELPPY